MNHGMLSPVARSAAPASAGTATTTQGGGDPLDADLFRVALAAQVAPPATTPRAVAAAALKATQTASSAAAATQATATTSAAQTALEAKIKKMIEAGASQAEIITALSTSLAAATAQQLNVTGSDARQKLQTLFATALAPPGEPDGSSGSAADRARILAQRSLKLLDLAQSTGGTSSGQQKRLSGTISDALAKDLPAPTTGTQLTALPSHRTEMLAQSAMGDLVGPTAAAVSAAAAANARASSAQVAKAAAAVTAASSVAATSAAMAVTVAKASAAAAAATTATASAAATATASATTAATVSAATASAASTASSAVAAMSAELGRAANTHAGLTARTLALDGLTGSSDGKTVALGSTAAVAADGDTTLGRILTRASLAADARQAATTAAAQDATTSAASQSAPAGAAASADPSADATVSAFIKSFATALRDSDAAALTTTAQRDAAQPATVPLPAASAGANTAFVPSPAPFTIDQARSATPTTPAPPASAPVPAEQSAIVDQVLRGAFMHSTGQSSEIRLSLVPETLGDVSVKLTVDAGNVSAHVIADTPEVRDAIVSAQPELSRSLADAGLKLTSFTVDVSGGGFAGFAQQQNDGSQTGQRSNRGTNAIDSDDDEDMAVDAVPTFGPPIDAVRNPGDLNHLA